MNKLPGRSRLVPLLFCAFCTFAAILLLFAGQSGQREVDLSTPRQQNGFRLVVVQRGDEVRSGTPRPLFYRLFDWLARRPAPGSTVLIPDGPGLRVATRWLPTSPPHQAAMVPPTPSNFFTAEARASTGDMFTLPWSIGWDGSQRQLFLHTSVGYPDTYRWLDVTVRDGSGHQARWRLGKLPRLRHAVPTETAAPAASASAPVLAAGTGGAVAADPPVAGGSRVTTPRGATIEARAWLNPAGGQFGTFDYIVSALRLARPSETNPPPERRWRLEIEHAVYEWEPHHAKRDLWLTQPYWSETGFRAASGGTGPGGRGVYARVEGVPAAPARSQARVRIHAVLREYDEISERAAFAAIPVRWNSEGSGRVTLPAPRQAVTPAGTLVSLEEAPAQTQSEPGQIALALSCRRSANDSQLVAVRDASSHFSLGTDNVSSSSAYSDDLRRMVLLVTPATGQKQRDNFLDELVVRVQREQDRARTPLVLTVPVSRLRPADSRWETHGGY